MHLWNSLNAIILCFVNTKLNVRRYFSINGCDFRLQCLSFLRLIYFLGNISHPTNLKRRWPNWPTIDSGKNSCLIFGIPTIFNLELDFDVGLGPVHAEKQSFQLFKPPISQHKLCISFIEFIILLCFLKFRILNKVTKLDNFHKLSYFWKLIVIF